MSVIVEEDVQYPFILPELENTEVEKILRAKPEIAKKFIEKMAKGEIGWEDFNPHERGLLLHGAVESSYKNADEISVIKSLREADWLRTPPTIEEFLEDPKYLGVQMSQALYKPWKEDLKYVLNPKNEIYSWVLSGGIGVGKSKIAIIAQLYKLAVLTCLKNINEYLGLDNATQISFGLFSLSLDKVEGALSEDFKKLISDSPYFKNVFPLKKARTAKRVLNNQSTFGAQGMAEYEVLLPQNLKILLGSKISHALSLAVVSAILDEMNFRGKRTLREEDDVDSAENLYNQIRYRITSRFERLGFLPGLLCVISSRTSTSGFIEAHIAKIDGGLSSRTGSWIAKNDPHCFISSYSQWDVKPENYSKEKFHVFIGSSKTSSRILTEEEYKTFPENSPSLLAVPVSARPHFENDINAALRELAGISSSPTHLLFEDPVIVKNVWNMSRPNPFKEEVIPIGLKTNLPISAYLKEDEIFYDAGFSLTPKYHPDMLRVIHIDLSKNKDLTGITMSGVSSLKEYRGRNLLGDTITNAISPQIFVDFSIGLKAPQGDQIDYEKIQQFISFLRKMGFRIFLVTFDQFAAVGPMQMLVKDGFTVDNLSVDRTDTPYRFLRDIVSKKNIDMPYSKTLEREMLNLLYIHGEGKSKVDHPKMTPDGHMGCFTGDTKVKLLDGRSLSFIELEQEFGNTKPIYLYTIKEGKVSVGIGRNPRKTKEQSNLVEVTLDNNEKIKCTPDHKFMLRDGTYKEAKDLQEGESLMPLYKKISTQKQNKMKGYELYYCPSDNKYHFTHRMVGKWKYPESNYYGNQYSNGLVIHHEKSKLNNSPDAIKLVTTEAHALIHRNLILEVRSNKEIEQKRIDNLKKYNDLPSTKKSQSERIKKSIHSDPIVKEKLLKAIVKTGKITGKINITKYNKSEKHRIEAAIRGKLSIWKAIAAIKTIPITVEDIIKLKEQKYTNKEIAIKYNCSESVVERRLSAARKRGLNVPNYSNNKKLNHKILSVKLLEEKQDVYDLTVDETHNFALDAGVFVHNSKDLCDALAGSIANCVSILTNTKKYPYTANANIAGRLVIGDGTINHKEIGPSQVDSRSQDENHDIESFINSVDPFKNLKG